MSALAWSNLGLWIVVIAEAVMILAILRYLGKRAVGESPPLLDGPPVGFAPPPAAMVGLDGHVIRQEDLGKHIRIVFFVSPECSACQHMMKALAEIASVADPKHLFVFGGSKAVVVAEASKNELDLSRVVADFAGNVRGSWGISRQPFVVKLSISGVVEDVGEPTSRKQLESLLIGN